MGALGGVAAVGFHRTIDLVNDRTLAPVLAHSGPARFALLALLLVTTGLIAGLCLEFAVPFARGSGIPEVKATYLFAPGPQLSFRTVVGKFVLGALSIGAGFSLGREGPTVQICAGIGAAVGKASRRIVGMLSLRDISDELTRRDRGA